MHTIICIVKCYRFVEITLNLVTLRRLKSLRCKIFHKHARHQMALKLFHAPRALLQIFITNAFNHRARILSRIDACLSENSNFWVQINGCSS
jgi:hypothetical protein